MEQKDRYGIFSLADKVIVVTGGTKKYGYYLCEGLAEAGGTVIVTSRDQERATQTAQRWEERGLKVFGYAYDQSRDDSIEELVQKVLEDHGRIDVLVNNARTIPQARAAEVTREQLNEAFNVNSVGLILMTRRVVEEMKRRGKGTIINIGSIYGMGGQDLGIYRNPESSISLDYPIQKGGMIAYTQQLSTILAHHGIRSNCLSLGGLDETCPDDEVFQKGYRRRTTLGRPATGADVKGPIVFLASDASAYMTGANLVVDGGWAAW